MNVLDDWVYASPQTTWADEEEKSFEPIINNETIPYAYVNYIYRGKNWECPVCGADDGYCEYYHCMMCKGLHWKDWVWRMKPNQRCECRELTEGDNDEEAY